MLVEWRRQPWSTLAARTTKAVSLRKGNGQTVHLWHPFLPQFKVQFLVKVFASQIIWLRKRFVGPGSFWKTSRKAAIGAAQHPPGIQLWELGQGFQELHLLALTHICILPSGETWRGKTGKGRKSWLCYLSIVSSLTASCQSLVFSDIKHVNSIAL